MSRRHVAQDVATVGLMIAVIEVCKLFMQGLPNIEMTSFLVILFTHLVEKLERRLLYRKHQQRPHH